MAVSKLTKNELRIQKLKQARLEKYLPTLKLKKALLQAQVQEVLKEEEEIQEEFNKIKEKLYSLKILYGAPMIFDFYNSIKIELLEETYENIAGIEVPKFHGIDISVESYSLLDTPIWLDSLIEKIKDFFIIKMRIDCIKRKKQLLSKELFSVSVRVNLFEKKLIPRTKDIIKKITIFLGDQLLSSLGQIKMAKTKIENKKLYYASRCR